jgi:hypothetical protein
MPVQINEMVIRANVLENDEKGKQADDKEHTSEAGAIDKSEIIKECAELVLEIINNKNQR